MSVDVRCARERSPSRRSTFFKAPRECGLILEEEEVKEEVEEETKEEERGYGTTPQNIHIHQTPCRLHRHVSPHILVLFGNPTSEISTATSKNIVRKIVIQIIAES